jgi:hypothetical protein
MNNFQNLDWKNFALEPKKVCHFLELLNSSNPDLHYRLIFLNLNVYHFYKNYLLFFIR